MLRRVAIVVAGFVLALMACSETDTGNFGVGGEPSVSAATVGGVGGNTGCASDGDCASDTACVDWSCDKGECRPAFAPPQTPAPSILGDCLKAVCDGRGAAVTIEDLTDAPSDKNPCTADSCVGGMAQHAPVDDGTPCGMENKLTCSDGVCVGCAAAAECPPGDTCSLPICDATTPPGKCDLQFQAGKEVANADPTDCYHAVCSPDGEIVVAAAPDDTPPPDDNDCDVESCSSIGGVIHTPVRDGTLCGASTFCHPKVCRGSVCGVAPDPPSGTPTPNDVAGDCLTNVCDGMGGAKNVNVAPGTACTTVAGGSCDGAGKCCLGMTCQ